MGICVLFFGPLVAANFFGPLVAANLSLCCFYCFFSSPFWEKVFEWTNISGKALKH